MAVKNSKQTTSASSKLTKVAVPVVSVVAEAAPAKVDLASVTVKAVAGPVEPAPVKPEPTPVVPVVAKVATPGAVAKPVAAKRASTLKVKTKKIAPLKAPVKVPAKAIVKTAPAKIARPIIQAAKAVANPAVKAADTVRKETKIMATKFEMPKFDAPKVFSEVNEKAKAAVEKSTKLVEEFNDFAKGNVEAIVESSKIAAKGLETLGQDAADYNRKSFDGLTATFKSFASVKSPADFFKLQSDFVRASFDAAVAQGSKNTEALIKLAGDAAQPLSNRFAVAAEKVKAAA